MNLAIRDRSLRVAAALALTLAARLALAGTAFYMLGARSSEPASATR